MVVDPNVAAIKRGEAFRDAQRTKLLFAELSSRKTV